MIPILDTLSGRSPLYNLEKTFADYDQSVLLSQVLPPGYFSDDNMGRIIDRIYEVGTQKIFSALSSAALRHFPVSIQHVHFDTTSSINIHGDNTQAEAVDIPFHITHGHSKDKHPELKQFVLSLLCVDGKIPIVGKLEDGKPSDKEQAIARCRQMIGCFVRLTKVPADKGYSAEKILRTDKDQLAIENNFSFLKDDQIGNAIFLK